MKFKSAIALAVALSFAVSVSSCASSAGNNKDKEAKGTTAASDETMFFDDGAEYEPLSLDSSLDYDGAEIRLLTDNKNEYYVTDEQGNVSENYSAGELTVEDLTNEPVNDAVYNREIYVEDLLNVDIVRTETPKKKNVREYVELMFNSGDVAAEIITADCAQTMWSSQFGYYLNLNEVDNINLNSTWWNQDFNTESSFGFKNYFVTGSLSLTLLRAANVIFYNRTIAKNNDIDSVYETVLDGKWTLDKLSEISSKVYVDTNGNSKADEEDVYGFMLGPLTADPLWSAFDINILSKDEDDYLVYEPDMEKFGFAFEKVFDLYDAKTTYHGNDISPDGSIYKYFAEDKTLFASSFLVKVETEIMRNMQSEYGIIPLPKYDEAQESYYTMSHDQYTVFGIMATLNEADAARSGAVLEAMGWYSYRYVIPTYLNIAMKGKYANDTETRQMLDVIVDGLRVDSAWIYAYYLDDYPQQWRYLLGDEDRNYASAYKQKERNIKILVKSLNETYRKLDEG